MLILDSVIGGGFDYAYALTVLGLIGIYFVFEYNSNDKRLGLILKPILIPLTTILVIMLAWPYVQLPQI